MTYDEMKARLDAKYPLRARRYAEPRKEERRSVCAKCGKTVVLYGPVGCDIFQEPIQRWACRHESRIDPWWS